MCVRGEAGGLLHNPGGLLPTPIFSGLGVKQTANSCPVNFLRQNQQAQQ